MRKYWLILILPLLVILWWGLDHRGSAPVIHFATAERLRIESTVSTNGKVEPAEWAAARAETSGVVRQIFVQRGQTVKSGETLVTLDTTAAQTALAEAEAQRQEAEAENANVSQGGKAAILADLNGKIATAEESVQVAQRNYDSMQRLAAQHAATKQQVQQARDTLDQAKLQLSALQDQRKTLVTANDKAVAQAKLRQSEASVAFAQHRIGLGKIIAPMAGTVYQLGNLPQDSETAGSTDLKIGAYLQPGALVALIGNLDQVKVIVYVDEPDLGRVALNDPVSITWEARPGQKWWGRVDRLPTQVISLQTRTVGEVTTIVNNPDHDLLPGVTVNAVVTSKIVDNALSIPKAALRIIHGTNGAFRLEGDKIQWTPITTGVSDINNVQILSGLKQGDRVADRVVEPSDAEIRNGMRVRPVTD